MSNEFNKEVEESILNEKIIILFNKFKTYIILLIITIVLLPVIYTTMAYYEKKQNEQEYYDLSLVLNNNSYEDIKEKILKLEKKILSKNEIISSVALNKLIEINIKSKDKILEYIDEVVKKNNINEDKLDLLKIKKSLIIFDTAEEQQMLSLLNIKDNNSFYRKMKLTIMKDFYKSKKNFLKANEIELLLNAI